MDNEKRLDYLIRYLDALAKLPHDGMRTDAAYRVRQEIEKILDVEKK